MIIRIPHKSTEANKAVVRQMFDAINASDLEQALELVSDDVTVYTQIPGITAGRDGRIAELWRHDDLLGLFQQLGAMPGAGR